MEAEEVVDDDIISQLNRDDLPDLTGILDEQVPGFTDSQSNPCASSWIGQVENMLMKDDDEEEGLEPDMQIYDHFLQDILADLPTNTSANASFVENSHGSGDGEGRLEKENKNINNGIAEDPVSKKRTRQLRNRDAAMRSRERKKMYVRDLEVKSRHLEGECRRLGRLLQCFMAENQALRLSLQKASAFGASSAKQESAVLLLESLLLGSLLWFLGIMCLLNLLPKLSKSMVVPLPGPEWEGAGSLALKGAGKGSNVVVESFLKNRGCKASRTKMKMEFLGLHVSA